MAQGSQLRLGGAGGYPRRPHLPSDILTCSFFKSQQFHLSLTWSWGDSPLALPRSLMGLPSPLPRHTERTPTGARWLQAGCSESCKRAHSRLNHLGPQEEPAVLSLQGGVSGASPAARSTRGWYQGARGWGPGQTPGEPWMSPQCHRTDPLPRLPPLFPLLCSLRSSAQPSQHHLPPSTCPTRHRSPVLSSRPQAPDPQSAPRSGGASETI